MNTLRENQKSAIVGVLLLTHNHAPSLERCLDSIRWADQIVMVDAGSSDETLAIAAKSAAHVYYQPPSTWALRAAFGLSRLTTDWTLYLRPDEWVEEMLKHEIEGVALNINTPESGFFIDRRLTFQRQPLNRFKLETPALRLFRRATPIEAPWAEAFRLVNLDGTTRTLTHRLGFEPARTLNELFDTVTHQANQAACRQLETDGPAKRPMGSATLLAALGKRFAQRFVWEANCLEGFPGLAVSLADAYGAYLKKAQYSQANS